MRQRDVSRRAIMVIVPLLTLSYVLLAVGTAGPQRPPAASGLGGAPQSSGSRPASAGVNLAGADADVAASGMTAALSGAPLKGTRIKLSPRRPRRARRLLPPAA